VHSELQLPSPDTIDAGLTLGDPLAHLPLERFGYRAGDILELDGTAYQTMRLAGGVDDLYAQIRL
jgi:hypothetical protein